MAYESGQGGPGSSWSQQGYGGQTTTSNHLWTGTSSGSEQSFHAGSSNIGANTYAPGWTDVPFANPHPRPRLYYQQPQLPQLDERTPIPCNTLPSSPGVMESYQIQPGHQYPQPQSYANNYQYVYMMQTLRDRFINVVLGTNLLSQQLAIRRLRLLVVHWLLICLRHLRPLHPSMYSQ